MGENNDVNRLKQELLKERERMSLFLSLDSGCFFEYDENSDTLAYVNAKFMNAPDRGVISNCTKELPKLDIVIPEDRELLSRFITEAERGECQFRIKKPDGDFLWCLLRLVRFCNSDGSFVKMGNIRDIDQEKRREDEILRRQERDGMTGFLLSDKLKSDISEFLKESIRGQYAFYLIDIDNFKKLTDRFGKIFGDAVLADISDEIKKILDINDIAGRVGDDEFVLFVKNAESPEKVKTIAQYIQKACMTTYAGEQKEFEITACIGIVLGCGTGDDFEQLFKKADIALYEAKKEKAGTYCIYDEKSMGLMLKNGHEYYNRYSQDFVNKRVSNENLMGQEMIRFAFDIMSTTKDVESAIHILLEKIGKQYSCDYVSVYERDIKSTDIHCTYYWCKEHGETKCVPDFTKESQISTTSTESGSISFFEINDVENSALDYPEKEVLKCAGTKAFLESCFYENGLYKGCVCIGNVGNVHQWTEKEKEAFVIITDIISSYLLRLRVSKRIQERMEYVQNYDELTGSVTLHKFKKEAKMLLATSEKSYAVVYSDITNFKYINDMYGYDIGDKVLRDYASMLSRQLKDDVLCARVSADNFVYLIPYENKKQLQEFVLDFSKKFESMQHCKNIMVKFVIVSGIYIIKDNCDIEVAIDNANIARKSLKRKTSKSDCRFYSTVMSEKIKHELEIEAVMADALNNGEFHVYLQPKIGLADDEIAGAEALVRWNKDGKQLKPDKFIPLFEKNGFVVDLDFYVYEKVCAILSEWKKAGKRLVPISVNVSRVHLLSDDFIDRLLELTEKYNIEPALLELELTESIFLDNTENALAIMRTLKEAGFAISIDDFGAGYSSLNLLKDMATDVIKLDKDFFGHGDMQKEEQIIISNIINMAKELNMKVLSEGIETEGQSEFLKNVSCDMAQGYYFAKPMPREEFEKML